MAREEHDREDLLAEATALVERAELALPGRAEPIVIGFRRDGCGSIYLTASLVWHFNSQGRLRRAFADGLLYKAEHGRLVALRREQGADEVQLVRRELGAGETARFLDELERHLDELRQDLALETVRIMRQIPVEGDVLGRIRDWLATLASPPQLADSPRAC
jgi:hypothetical protein